MKKLRRIVTVTFEDEEKNVIPCPKCHKGSISFKDDNYPEGEEKVCSECNTKIHIRTIFTNL